MTTDPAAEHFASYLSRLQLERIAARTDDSVEPASVERPGAVLFVDATGFTSLTNRFAERGRAGVEDLSAFLNS